MRENIPWDLIISKLKKQITPAQELQLSEWLFDKNNQEVYDELCSLWDNLQKRYSAYTPDVELNWEKLSRKIAKDRITTPSLSKVHFILNKKIAVLAVAAIALLIINISIFKYNSAATSQVSSQTYSSIQGKSKVQLPDGTEVWLHNNSELTYHSDYGTKKRSVKLTGEAFFKVSHNKDIPFIVDIDGLSVNVHGTSFNVRNDNDLSSILVSLEEGSISLKTSDNEYFVKPGEVATYNKTNKSMVVNRGDINLEKCWMQNEISFKDKDLEYITSFLSRWYGTKITVDPTIAKEYIYTFTLRDEKLEDIVRIMSRINPMEYSFSANNELTIKKNK